jgi:hypothetical protein
MRWKYYIPAVWKPDERQTWEDVWLLPDDESYQGESVWLTIDSLTSAAEYLTEEETRPRLLPKQGEFSINGADMFVGVEDFSKEELLQWVVRWLEESGFSDAELIEATFEEFKDTNDEARAATQAIERASQEEN